MRLKDRVLAWKWLIPLTKLVMRGEISLSDATSFINTRLSSFRLDFTLNGIRFHSPDRDIWAIARNIFIYREYNPPNLSLHCDDVVADIGAHKGVFTAYAACVTHSSVLAFEPDRQNFLAMESLIRLNGLNQAKIYNLAVTGENGYVNLFKSKATTRHSMTGKDLLTGEALVDFEMVPSLSLDEALRNQSRIDFLKMDCEGAEFDIIKHASSETIHKIRKWALEYHCCKDDEKLRGLVNRLETEGFSITICPHPKNIPLGMLFADGG